MQKLICQLAFLASVLAHRGKGKAQSWEVQAGYHVIWSYSGSSIPQSIFTAAEAGQVGGLILFGENVNDNLPSQLSDLQTAYANSANYAGYPLLIVTDQEGGEVARLPGGPTQSAKQVGESSNPAAAGASAGTTIANVFSQYNVNGDLAPVLGVYRSPGDFLDQYQRSYGQTAALVSECIGPLITNLQNAGYFATAKHFPGLGAANASQDTDVEPVTINLPLSTLRSVDEAPYTTAISHGVRAVMPSWALYPALDAEYPSGLSVNWVTNELRGRLGFDGVTITDAIEAGALEAFGDSGDRAVRALVAGQDIILAAAMNTTQGPQVVDAIVAAVESGEISSASFSASNSRILNLRRFVAESGSYKF